MRKKNIVILLGVSLLQGMCFYAPIATLYRQAAGITLFEMSVIESASFALSLLLEVPWGIAADRIGYRKTMVLCTALFFVSKVIFWKAESFGMFLAERLLLSVVIAGLSGVDASILWLSAGEKKAQKVFGLYSACGTAGLIVASVVCAAVVGDNYRLSGLLTVIAYGASALLVLFLGEVKEATNDRKPPLVSFKNGLRQFFHSRGLMPLVLCGAMSGEVCRQVSTFINQLQYVRCGMDERIMAVVYGLTTLVGLCGVFSSELTKRAGARQTGLLLLGSMAVSCLLLAATTSAVLSIAAILIMCAVSALYGPLAATMENRLIVAQERATALSVNTLVSDGVAIPLTLLLGRLAEVSLPGTFLLCALVCGLAAALFGCAEAHAQHDRLKYNTQDLT